MSGWKEKLADITVVEGIFYLLVLAGVGTLVDVATPWWDLRGAFTDWGMSMASLVGEMAKSVIMAVRGQTA